MKKYFLSILCFVAVATFFAACSKSDNEPINPINPINPDALPEVSYWAGSKALSTTTTIDGEEVSGYDDNGEVYIVRLEKTAGEKKLKAQICYYDINSYEPVWGDATLDNESGILRFPKEYGMEDVKFNMVDNKQIECTYKDASGKEGILNLFLSASSDTEFASYFEFASEEEEMAYYGFLLDETDGVAEPLILEGKSAEEFLKDPFSNDEPQAKAQTRAIIPFNPMDLFDAITGVSDKIDDLSWNMEYYFEQVLQKLEIIDAKLDMISQQIDAVMQGVQAVYVQQQTINLLDAKNKRSEFANKILTQNNQYLPAIDTILSKILYLEKHPDEEYVLVGLPLFPKGEEQELSVEELEQRLCQNLELWHRHGNQAHTKVIEFMEFLKGYSTALGDGFPRIYDKAIYNSLPWEHYGYDARTNFRLADLDIVMKTVHLSGLYQQRMIQALDNMEEEEWIEYFPLTPYPASDAQLSSSKAQLTSEMGQLQDTYSKFFNFYKETKVVRRDDRRVCQIKGAEVELNTGFIYIDYPNHSWKPNKWYKDGVGWIYGFQGNAGLTRQKVLQLSQARAMIGYYNKSLYDILVNDGKVTPYNNWQPDNKTAILLGPGCRWGDSYERRVMWADCFFSAYPYQGLRPHDDGNGSSHMGAVILNHKDGNDIQYWQLNSSYQTQFITLFQK